MKLIPLHGINGRGKFTQVDDEDYEFLNQFRWFGIYQKTSNNYYVIRNSSKGATRMHVLIMGKKEGFVIDHIDGDTFNNQRSNLRHCTYSENGYNRKNYRNGISEYKGVCKNHRNGNKWVARIQKDKKQYNLGTFETEEMAALAYNKAAIELFGEFAQLNIINKDNRKRIDPPKIHVPVKKEIPEYTGELPLKSKAIYLSKGKFAIVSEEDYEWLNQWKWGVQEKENGYFVAYRNGKRMKKGNREKRIIMHRFIMNPKKGLVVDHINRNPLDNRRENLRVVTQKVNSYNRKGMLPNPKYVIQLKCL